MMTVITAFIDLVRIVFVAVKLFSIRHKKVDSEKDEELRNTY